MTSVVEAFRMSPQQRQVWFPDAGEDRACATLVLELTGPVDRQRLETALATLVDRHEILRTVYPRRPGMRWPHQGLTEALPVAWSNGKDAVALDPAEGPVVGAALRAVDDGRHHLTLSLLAPSVDEASLLLLADELATVYDVPAALEVADEDEEPLQFVQFSEWQNETAEEADPSEVPEALREVEASSLDLPGVAPRDPEPDALGASPAFLPLPWSASDASGLTAAAARAGVSERAWLLTAWRLYLGRLDPRSRLPIEVTLDGRKFEEMEGGCGRFARRVPLELKTLTDSSLDELARRVEQRWELAEEHQELLGNDSEPSDSTSPGDAVTFLHRDHPAPREAAGVRFVVQQCRAVEPAALLGLRVWGTPVVGLELAYDSQRLDPTTVERWGAGLLALVRAASSTDTSGRAARLDAVGEDERQQIQTWTQTPEADPQGSATLVEQLASLAQGEATTQPAVVAGGSTWTYGELWQRSGQLATTLRQRGVGLEDRVGLLLPRSADLVASLLGTWRAGAAYLPLDPGLPTGRLAQLVEAAGVEQVVTTADLAPQVPEACSAVVLGSEATATDDLAELPDPATLGPHLAYVLFTSGSTGEPKGVMVEHQQVTAYVDGAAERLEAEGVGYWAMVSTFAADLGLTALLLPLAQGGAVHVLSAAEASDPAAFRQRMDGVEGLKIVPSHLAALMAGDEPEAVLPSQRLVLGGEACPPELVGRIRALAPELRIFNHYGPTEATVGATAGEVAQEVSIDPGTRIPLGRPLAGRRVALLDALGEPCPLGVAGELGLAGAGLARGYLGRPAATAERFVPDAGAGETAGARIYRTGDRARLKVVPEGALALHFLGRLDHQVKLRGFRIELGEVAAVLATHDAVDQAVAMVRDEGQGQRLVAYFSGRPGGVVDEAALLEQCADRLPDYMVPSALVRLDQWPLNANGKLDRSALPAPESATGEDRYLAPRNDLETTLCTLWGEVLGVERVGVRDDFFALGGDSILAIQLIGRAGREGLAWTPQELFDHRTIEGLAPWVTRGARTLAEQGKVVGELPLTPIQRWYLEGDRVRLEHFNQSVLLATPKPLDADRLRRVLALLADHHDVLRSCYSSDGEGGHRAEILDDVTLTVDAFDLSDLKPTPRQERLEAACHDAQQGFDLAGGALLRALVFDLGEAGGRLLLTAHHLLVDGVSWRILLGDLETLYRQLEGEQTPRLQPKTTSFRQWATTLVEQAQEGTFDDELDHWRSVGEQAAQGLVIEPSSGGTMASSRRATASLDEASTRALLEEVPPVYNTGINDALLAALVLAHGQQTGAPRLLVDLEGHGREEFVDGLDLSRTVGWFTTHYPVWLDLVGSTEPGAALKQVKETLRAIPRSGLGHGVLRWLGEGATAFRGHPEPAVSFNYLGRFDGVLGQESELRLAPESPGPERAPEERRATRYEVSGSVLGGKLQLAVTYSEELDDGAAMEAWLSATCDTLRALVEHCRSPEAGGFTPSDFPLADLGMDDLDSLSQLVDDLDAEVGA